MEAFILANKPLCLAVLYAVLKLVQAATAARVAKPNPPAIVSALNAVLLDLLHVQLSVPNIRTAISDKPVVGSTLKLLVLGTALLAGTARAQVFSAGASLPMLEFGRGSQPVDFAPGVGVSGAVGLFQFEALGKSWDALNLSIQLFGNSPGAFQAAALVGTFNDIIAFGVAIPLAAADGSGAFQGQFHAYPVLSLSIPIAFGPFAPPVGIADGPIGLPRGGTLFL